MKKRGSGDFEREREFGLPHEHVVNECPVCLGSIASTKVYTNSECCAGKYASVAGIDDKDDQFFCDLNNTSTQHYITPFRRRHATMAAVTATLCIMCISCFSRPAEGLKTSGASAWAAPHA